MGERASFPLYFGPPLERPFAAILNSRQTKMPCGSDGWVGNTVAAAAEAVARGFTALTAIGMNTWELVVWAVNDLGGKQIIVHPLYECEDPRSFVERVSRDFELSSERTGFLFFETDKPANRPKLAWPERDGIILREAEYVYPVSVRENGNIRALLGKYSADKRVSTDFSIKYERGKRLKISMPDKRTIENRFPPSEWNFVTHWTRAFHGPWPGENSASYYAAVAGSGEDYPRSALNSLIHILEGMRISGSSSHIRKAVPVVSFTEHPPSEAVGLMRYRSRWVRYTFEPYGIAIGKETAFRAGVRGVIYGGPEVYEGLREEDRPLFQPTGTLGDWTAEREFRHVGDLDLNELPTSALRIVVPGKSESERLSGITDIELLTLSD